MAVYNCKDCALMDLNDASKYDKFAYWCSYFRKYYNPGDRACSHAVPKSQGGSNCYITTAICDILNYDDDCDYLRVLRNFRDTYMMNDISCLPLLEEYDEVGPLISDCIWNDPNKKDVSEMMLNCGIRPAYYCILSGDGDSAIKLYINMVENLKTHYGLENVTEKEKFTVRERKFKLNY